jgi:tetratricopeptide (TPR) repeat protein
MPAPSIAPLIDLLSRSVSLCQSGLQTQALDCLDEALQLQPLFLPALFHKVELLAGQHRHDEAILAVDATLAVAPESEALLNLRHALMTNALDELARRLDTDAQDTDALFQRGNLALSQSDAAAAIADFRQVLALEPEHLGACNNLGNALLIHNLPDEAISCYDRVLAQTPHDANAWFNRGNAYQQLNRLDDALGSYARATDLAPEFAEAHMESAHCLLCAGHYVEGWSRYEWRWQTRQLAAVRLCSDSPLWLGPAEALRHKTILVWAEQGLGDAIQFVRFVPQLLEHAKQVLVRCPASLSRLFSRLDTRLRLIDDTEPLPAHDVQCPLMSLPLALSLSRESLAATKAYLCCEPILAEAWRERLGPSTRPRIGLAWAGRQSGLRNRTRDIPLALLLPLLALDAEFVVLQKEVSAKDLMQLKNFTNVRVLGPELVDFADTAALLDNLDSIVCVDTAIAHLAGAIGKSCNLLLRHSGEWRWLLARTDSPWYPSLHLYRQQRPGDWTTPVMRVVESLASGLAQPSIR